MTLAPAAFHAGAGSFPVPAPDLDVDPAFVPFLVGAIGTLAAFSGWLIRDAIADARKQRDIAIAGWQSQAAVTEKLADALRDRNVLDERLLQSRAGR